MIKVGEPLPVEPMITSFILAPSKDVTPVSRRTAIRLFEPKTRPSQVKFLASYLTLPGRRTWETRDISGGISRYSPSFGMAL